MHATSSGALTETERCGFKSPKRMSNPDSLQSSAVIPPLSRVALMWPQFRAQSWHTWDNFGASGCFVDSHHIFHSTMPGCLRREPKFGNNKLNCEEFGIVIGCMSRHNRCDLSAQGMLLFGELLPSVGHVPEVTVGEVLFLIVPEDLITDHGNAFVKHFT